MKHQLAFGGEVAVLTCDCHKGQIVAIAYFVHPSVGRQPIGEKIFPTLEEAEIGLEPFVQEIAASFMKTMGVEPTGKPKVKLGDAAIIAEREMTAARNGATLQ